MRMAKRKVKKTVTCELEGMLRRHVAGKFFRVPFGCNVWE